MGSSEPIKVRIQRVRRRKRARKDFACETLESKIRLVERKRRGGK